MSAFSSEKTLTKIAAAQLARYRVCYIDSNGKAAYAPASHPGPLYVSVHAAESGASVALLPLDAYTGIIVLVCAAAVANGGRVSVSGAAGKVDETGVGPTIGTALEAGTADGAEISVARFAPGSRNLYATLANSSTHTNSTVATNYDKSVTLPAGILKKGDKLRIRAGVRVPSSNGTDTLNLKLLVGTEEICATGALNITNDDIAVIDAEVIVRADGASGALAAAGFTSIGVIGSATMKPFLMAEAAEDLSVALVVAVQATYSVAHADNQSRLEHLSVELIPA